MRIFAEVLPTSLGRAMYRINRNLRKYAPEWVTFTANKDEADFQILDVIGKGSIDFLYKKNYAVLQHCFLSSDDASKETWLPIFDNAKLVATYMNLPELIKSNSFNFLRMPWGVDAEIFQKKPIEKVFTVLTTGYVAETESINEVYDAVNYLKGTVVHVGKNFKFGDRFHSVENISEEKLVELYNKSYYVSGLRKMEGFELPILEGLLCGARGICYNCDHYRHWFSDLVDYIDEDDYAKIGLYSNSTRDQLAGLLSYPYRAVTNEEIEYAKKKFSWETIMTSFWKRLEESL